MRKLFVVYFTIVTVMLSAGIVAAQTITLATMNWPPFYSNDLPEHGFFTAISKEAFKRTGYEMKVKFFP